MAGDVARLKPPEAKPWATWRETAWAKINVSLKVGGRRRDGYHDVATVVHALALSDVVWVRVWKRSRPNPDAGVTIEVTSDHPGVPDGPSNLAWQAAKRLEPLIQSKAPDVDRIAIAIDKAIPVAAGLGGGSADAAAVLRALNAGLSLGLDEAGLAAVGAELGSDVPACVLGGTSVGRGRGEQVAPVESGKYWWALANPGGGLAAGQVYAAFAEQSRGKGAAPPSLSPRLLAALRSGDATALAKHLSNDLQDAAARLHSGIQPLLDQMKSMGAVASVLCGSGPTVCGLAADEQGARRLAEALHDAAPWTWWGPSA